MTYSKANFDKVAKALASAERLSAAPDGLFAVSEAFDVVMLKEGAAFTMLYAQKHGARTYARGITGFVYEGRWYHFDRTGCDDSWYPEDFKQKMRPVAEIVLEMREQIKRALERHAAHVRRQQEGKLVNFGPTSRTLMPNEIENFKKMLQARRAFSLTPSGFGTGYRFYIGAARNRYGQGVPASDEARKLFNAPGLVYDTMDCD